MNHQQRVAELYTQHAPAIQRYILRRVHDYSLAEDLTSEVFVRVLESLHTYTDRGLPIEAWLYRIAHDRVIDSYRSQRRRPVTSLDACEIETPQSPAYEAENESAFIDMLNHLTEEQRAVLLLRYGDELTFAEIATKLARTEGSVKQLNKRGIRQLKGVYRPVISA
jgi:RNA polymerase sigma-70 factor (ECF subfamily)